VSNRLCGVVIFGAGAIAIGALYALAWWLRVAAP